MTRFRVTIREGDFWDDGVGWEASAGQPGLAAPERCLVITGSIDEVVELLTRFYLSGVRDERGKR